MTTTAEQVTTDWRDWYDQRLVPADEAMAHVKSGDRVWISPQQYVSLLLSVLVGRAEELHDVEIRALVMGEFGWYDESFRGHIDINTYFASIFSRDAVKQQQASFTPWMVWGAHKALDQGRPGARPIDVALVSVTPPNANGYCCFGPHMWDAKTTAARAKTVIAAVNEHLPRAFGDTWIHVSQIDWFVEDPTPLPDYSRAYPPPDPWDQAIAGYVGTLIRDGDVIQVGTGSTTGNLVRLGAFEGKHDLGYFAELTVPGLVDLARQGVITSRNLNLHPGKFVTSTAGNGADDLAFIADNPMFEFYSTEYMHDPRVIGRIDDLVAINNALTVDLTGQVGAGNLGYRAWSGTGGHLSYAMGAFLSKGGRYICVLPATAVQGTVSRVVSSFEPGQIVTVPRDLADYVVTEYGIAQLLNKTERERACELIAIAHPDFRADLRREAERMF
jgi:4-hydroxybutyrate CoA-transferase